MFDSPEDFAAYLDKLAERAPKLRDAGVLNFEAGAIKAQLIPITNNLTAAPVQSVDDDDTDDPWDDPAAYGLPPGSAVPYEDEPEESDQ